jgi:hypothetical protein
MKPTLLIFDQGVGAVRNVHNDIEPYLTDEFNIFEQLLERLEGSKGRQQRQKSLEGRRDIYSQGLASMMSNF